MTFLARLLGCATRDESPFGASHERLIWVGGMGGHDADLES